MDTHLSIIIGVFLWLALLALVLPAVTRWVKRFIDRYDEVNDERSISDAVTPATFAECYMSPTGRRMGDVIVEPYSPIEQDKVAKHIADIRRTRPGVVETNDPLAVLLMLDLMDPPPANTIVNADMAAIEARVLAHRKKESD
jgi:hypothetical protein